MFSSFFLGGFECAAGYNRHRQWFDQIAATQHEDFVEDDYARLRSVGIRAAREGVRWPLVDRGGGRYDFSSVQPFVEAGRRHGIELIYDLFHFGCPGDVDLFSPNLPERFADYCYAAARFISARTEGICYFTPVNEPSYFSWAAGEVGQFAPYAEGRGFELKVALIRAAIAGIDAIRAACPAARIVNVDPLCRVSAPHDRPDLCGEVDGYNYSAVFEGWDMLAGRLLPELGGSPRHLDIIGINYYWTNQWELHNPGFPLAQDDPRCYPLRDLIREVWERYGAAMLLTETSHVGEMRASWLQKITEEVAAVVKDGLPLHGICLYPILGMPEWHARHEWTRMGLWDLEPHEGNLRRVLHEPMLEVLLDAERRFDERKGAVKINFAVA